MDPFFWKLLRKLINVLCKSHGFFNKRQSLCVYLPFHSTLFTIHYSLFTGASWQLHRIHENLFCLAKLNDASDKYDQCHTNTYNDVNRFD